MQEAFKICSLYFFYDFLSSENFSWLFTLYGHRNDPKGYGKAIEDFESHFDLIYGQYVVDAKSLLGVMTMDIRNKVDLRIMERENEMPTIMKAISPYIAA